MSNKVMVLAAALLLTPLAQAQMNLPGSFAVSPSGAATYTIPIQVPPGVAGMAPKLALSYSSQSGNGLLGVGWNLSGLSAVTRCPQTRAQDGASAVPGVAYKLSDRYCLDGQRLMLMAGTEGGHGAEYRTEIDGASKVTAYAEAGASDGPGSFVVRTKAGLTMEFGKTADSRIQAPGRGAVRAWALNKVTDTKGNYYTVSYTEDSANGQFYPQKISYGGNNMASPALAPQLDISLEYDFSRRDIVKTYYAGMSSYPTARLTGIRSSALAYRFNYGYGPDNRSRIESITACSADNTACHPALNIEFDSSGSAQLSMSRWETRNGSFWDTQKWMFEDMDGDGLTDLVNVFRNSDGTIAIDVHRNTGSTFQLQRWQTNGGGYWDEQQWHVMDVNGDGRMDLVKVFGDNAKQIAIDVHLNTGSSFVLQRWQTNGGGFWDTQKWFVMDANGDGRPDLVKVFNENEQGAIDVHLNTGSSFVLQRWQTNGGGYWDTQKWFVMDANGDGRPDLVKVFGDNARLINIDVHLNTGSKFTLNRWETANGNFWDSQKWFVMDVNGDGLADLVNVFGDTSASASALISIDVHVNTGTGFSRQRWETRAGSFWDAQKWFAADVNGDGLPDLVNVFGDNGIINIDVHVNSGSGFSLQRWESNAGGFWDAQKWFAFDANGDGLPDLVNVFNDAGLISVDTHASQFKPLLAKGFSSLSGAHRIAVDYDNLSRSLNRLYFKDLSTSFPRMLVHPPLQVVSQSRTSNGTGGQRVTNYAYGNFVIDVSPGSRGPLGFGWMQQHDTATGLATRTSYRQEWPFIGMPFRVAQGTSPAAVDNLGVTETQYTMMSLNPSNLGWTCADAGVGQPGSCSAYAVTPGQRYILWASQTDTRGNDWDGTNFFALPGSRVLNQNVDMYGNVGTVTTQVLSAEGAATGHAKTVTNTYAPADTANWILGRLLRSQVTSTSP